MEALLARFMQASDERMARIDQRLEQAIVDSNERIARIDQRLEQFIASTEAAQKASDERLTRLEQIVESNNRSIGTCCQACPPDLSAP